MPAKPPSLATFPQAREAPPDLSEYPDLFIIRKADLVNFKLEKGSTRLLSQLADLLILFENACARQPALSTSALAECTVFLLGLLININDPKSDPDHDFQTH